MVTTVTPPVCTQKLPGAGKQACSCWSCAREQERSCLESYSGYFGSKHGVNAAVSSDIGHISDTSMSSMARCFFMLEIQNSFSLWNSRTVWRIRKCHWSLRWQNGEQQMGWISMWVNYTLKPEWRSVHPTPSRSLARSYITVRDKVLPPKNLSTISWRHSFPNQLRSPPPFVLPSQPRRGEMQENNTA